MSVRRLNKESASYPKEGPLRFAGPVPPGGDLTSQQWMICPVQGPLDGQHIGLKVTIPNEYPFKPPEVKLDRPLFHPNVNQQSMCLDTITGWAPSTVITDVVKEVLDTITNPNLAKALNPEAAELYMSNRAAYNVRARTP